MMCVLRRMIFGCNEIPESKTLQNTYHTSFYARHSNYLLSVESPRRKGTRFWFNHHGHKTNQACDDIIARTPTAHSY